MSNFAKKIVPGLDRDPQRGELARHGRRFGVVHV